MILIRDIFQLKFGRAKDAMALLKEGTQLMKKAGHAPDRVLTDLVGNFYSLVMETTANNLSEFEATMKEAFTSTIRMPEPYSSVSISSPSIMYG